MAIKKITHDEVNEFVQNLMEPAEQEDATSVFKKLMASRQSLLQNNGNGGGNVIGNPADKLVDNTMLQSQEIIKRAGDTS